ncbi:MAG: hypothetical protein RIQ56_962 [Candidatus Parcubacteria bacterium]
MNTKSGRKGKQRKKDYATGGAKLRQDNFARSEKRRRNYSDRDSWIPRKKTGSKTRQIRSDRHRFLHNSKFLAHVSKFFYCLCYIVLRMRRGNLHANSRLSFRNYGEGKSDHINSLFE